MFSGIHAIEIIIWNMLNKLAVRKKLNHSYLIQLLIEEIKPQGERELAPYEGRLAPWEQQQGVKHPLHCI